LRPSKPHEIVISTRVAPLPRFPAIRNDVGSAGKLSQSSNGTMIRLRVSSFPAFGRRFGARPNLAKSTVVALWGSSSAKTFLPEGLLTRELRRALRICHDRVLLESSAEGVSTISRPQRYLVGTCVEGDCVVGEGSARDDVSDLPSEPFEDDAFGASRCVSTLRRGVVSVA